MAFKDRAEIETLLRATADEEVQQFTTLNGYLDWLVSELAVTA